MAGGREPQGSSKGKSVFMREAVWSGAAVAVAPVRGGPDRIERRIEKGIWWMPWRQEAMKDVARCEKPGLGASDR
jgi:hypothetical protein